MRVQSDAVGVLADRFQPIIAQSCIDLPDFSKIHRDFVDDCLTVIYNKRKASSGRLFGEMFPYIAIAGLKLPDEDRRQLAAAWLAMYGYATLVDLGLDEIGHLGARSSLGSSALLSWSVATIARFTADTPYADTFKDNIAAAFSGQYQDVTHRGDRGYD